MTKRPGLPVRGSTTGRPIMVLFDALGQKWSMRILWELRDGPLSFRELRARCDDVSPTSLNQRLKDLKELNLVNLSDDGYSLTKWGAELGERLTEMDIWAARWAEKAFRPKP